MRRIVPLVALLAGAVLVLVGIVVARGDSTSEGAGRATLLVVAGIVLLVVAGVAALMSRRRGSE